MILGGAGYGCWRWWKSNAATPQAEISANQTAQVERRTILSTVEVSGDIQPGVQVDVKPEISARIKSLSVQLGDRVKQGQTLLELDDHDLLTEKEQADIEIVGAKLSLDKAVKDYERDKALFGRGLVAKQTLSDTTISRQITENELEKSMKRLQIVRDKLAKTKIPAPMNGVILNLPVVVGQVVVGAASVNSGTVLLSLADLSQLIIAVHINQVDVARLKPGMPVEFSVDSIPDVVMKGKIDTIAPTATIIKNIKGFAVTISIARPDPRLKPGMTADVTIPIEKAEKVLSVPLAAVFAGVRDRKIVYVQPPGEHASPEKREVEVGLSNLDYVEIKSGVTENETVLLTRPAATKPGS